VGAVICHVPLQAATVSQFSTGFEPYSHSRPTGEQDAFVGTLEGHKGAGPPSEQPPVHAPLLLPLPPPLLLLLPPPLLLLLPPLPPCPPLLLLLPPPLLLPLPPPLLLPLPPLLLPPPLPASLSVVNAVPPHAGIARISDTTHALPHRHRFMTSERSEACASAISAKAETLRDWPSAEMCHPRHMDRGGHAPQKWERRRRIMNQPLTGRESRLRATSVLCRQRLLTYEAS
jgi:hypothetical protein